MEEKLKELKARLGEINDIESVLQLLEWEQQTYMPLGGAPARGRQMATLGRLAHEKFIDPAVGALLDLVADGKIELKPFVEFHPMSDLNELLTGHGDRRPVLIPDFQ